MRQFSNTKLIRRNGRFGRAMMYLGLGLTIVAAALVFRDQSFVLPALILMLIGGLFSQIGTALYNRFGREPRVDQILDASLKGLDDRYATFHYELGTDHVLITPDGIFALIPRWEKGQIRFENGKWYHQKPKGRLSLRTRKRVLRGLKKEALRELQSLEKSLSKHLKESEDLTVSALIVFIAKEAELDLAKAPVSSVHRKKLKGVIRNLERGKSISEEGIRRLAKSANV